jgi:membrane protein DedA with SNARE-associated domain
MFDLISTEKIVSLLIAYRYAIFFPITIIEGPAATIIAGFLVSLGYFNFMLVFLIAVAGDVLGDLIYYQIGRAGTSCFSRRLFFVKGEQFRRLQHHFKEHPVKTFLFGKWTHAIGAAILIAGGIAKVPMKQFLWWNFLGTLPKAFAFLIIGYFFGHAYREINQFFGSVTLGIFIVMILGIAVYLLIEMLRKRIHIDEI